MVAVVIILITILFISIIIYASIFIQHLTNVFLCNAFIFILDFHWYFDWIDIYWCTWKRRGWAWWWSCKRYIFKFLDWCFSLFIGEKERVPFVRHDLYKKKWEAIRKILAKAFNDTGYFPTMISKSFVQSCFYGDVSNTELLSSF